MVQTTEKALLGFEHAPIGLAVTRHRVVEICNRQLCQTFGYEKSALCGHSLSQLYPSDEEFHRIGQIGLAKMRGGVDYVDERIMRRRDGGLFWCRVRGHSLTPEDPFEQAVWSFVDLSETREVAALTQRERQVAMLLVEGCTSKEIARELSISHRTVESHRANLMKKYCARNGAELIAHLAGISI